MGLLHHYVSDTLSNALDSRMCTADKALSIAVSEISIDSISRKSSRAYPEIVN